jgi:hypothetical protein
VQFKDVAADSTYSFINASGRVNTIASTTANAGFNVAQGVAPTSPTNGDIWTTSASLFVRINGVTQTIPSTTTLGSYLTTGTAASTYLTISNASATYLSGATAATTYLPLAGGTLTGSIAVGPISGFTTTINNYGIGFDGGKVIDQEESHITGFNINLPASGTITNCGSITFADSTTQTTASIPDAPSDGETYARLNGAWVIIS